VFSCSISCAFFLFVLIFLILYVVTLLDSIFSPWFYFFFCSFIYLNYFFKLPSLMFLINFPQKFFLFVLYSDYFLLPFLHDVSLYWCWTGSPSWGGTDGYKSRKRYSPTFLSSLKDGGPWRWQKVRYLRSTWFTTPYEPRAKTTTTTYLCTLLP